VLPVQWAGASCWQPNYIGSAAYATAAAPGLHLLGWAGLGFRLTQQSVCDSSTKIRALSNLEQVKQVDKQMIRWFNDVE